MAGPSPAAYEQETDPEIKAFLAFVKDNKAESDLTREIATMVQTKKFEQSFINEYLAWSMHDKDVEMRGRNEGRNEGKVEAARNALAMGLSQAQVSQITGLSVEDIARL